MADPLARLQRVRHSNAWIFGAMLFFAALSLIASFVLSLDAIELAKDPEANLSCNINSVISCGTVGTSWQAEAFGFPNAFLGLIATPVIITLAVAGLGGARFPRWFMLGVQLFYTGALGFAYWLFYQSMFNIGALSPWCLVVTTSTTLVFVALAHLNIRDNNLFLPTRVQDTLASAVRANVDLVLVVIWLLVLALAILMKYGNALFG